MACGCPADQCTCVMSGDAYTGGSGNAADPFVVENTPFAPTSPLNSIQFTPGGVKNHSPGIDVALSSDASNAITYDVDGILVDPCDMVDAVATENALTCGPDGLLVDRCDILTPTIQALGDILIAGPDCTAQVMASPTAGDQVIAALAGQWGQRPLLSADGGNASSIGTDGGIWSPSFGAAAPTYGVQYFNTDGTINPVDGPIVWVESTGLPNDIITMPPAIIGAQYDIYNLSGINRISIAADASDDIQSNIAFAAQIAFDLPPGYAYRLTCLATGTWYAQQLTFDKVLGIGGASFSNPLNPLPDMKIKAIWAVDALSDCYGDFVYRGVGAPKVWDWVGGQEAVAGDSSNAATNSTVYVSGGTDPTITTQRPGIFDTRVSLRIGNDTVNQYSVCAIDPPSAAPTDSFAALIYSQGAPNAQASVIASDVMADAAAGAWKMKQRVTGGTGYFQFRYLKMTPRYITI